MIILQNKRVSVVIPNYNYGKYIASRIDSVVKQTYPIYELIVLDDCSTDNSVDVIEKKLDEIREKHPEIEISFVKNKVNSGKAISQWKKGFELAKGDYVWIAEADDSCSKRFLEEAMKGFDDPEVVLSYTESMLINGAGIMIAPNFRWSRDREKTGHYKKSYIKDGFREVEEIMAIRCTIPNVSAVVFKKDDRLFQYLKEAEEYEQVGDWYFYVRILEKGKIAYNRKALNRFRIHGGSATNRGQNHFDEVVEMHKFIAIKRNLDEFVTRRMMVEEERIKKKLVK